MKVVHIDELSTTEQRIAPVTGGRAATGGGQSPDKSTPIDLKF